MIFQEDMVKGKGKRLQSLLPDSRFQLAFPDDDGMPSHFCQPMQHLMVPLSVSPDLILPELGIRFRHHIVNALEAWKTCKGDPSIIVAILDEGVMYTHPDLAANMWCNPGESVQV